MNNLKTILKYTLLTVLISLLAACSSSVENIKINEVIIKTSNGHGAHLVFTDKGIFTNEDSLTKLKFNSSELHGYMKEGSCYEIEYWLWRVEILSMYPNILKAEKINC